MSLRLGRTTAALLGAALLAAACGRTRVVDAPAPVPGELDHFDVVGDSRSGNAIYSQLLHVATLEGAPRFIVHLGDIISEGGRGEELALFVKLTRTFVEGDDFYPIPGNHDLRDAASRDRFVQAFPRVGPDAHYTARLDDGFFVFANSVSTFDRDGDVTPEEQAWIEAALASSDAASARYRIVVLHHPPFPQNHHRDKPLRNAEALHALFVAHRVTLVLSGHEHSYSHQERDGIHYVISGGAGSPLYEGAGPRSAFYHYVSVARTETTLHLRAVDILGKVHDEFDVAY